MNKTIGFIGMGNMALAIASGIIKSGKVKPENIYAYAPHYEKLEKNAEKIGFIPCRTLKDMVDKAQMLIMACKPYQIEQVLGEIEGSLKGKTLLSVALGWDFKRYSKYLGTDTRIQFIMPNTPAMVGEGVFLFEEENTLRAEERKEIMELFSSMGVVQELPSNLMGIGGAITGCGPAFVDMVIEALGDAAVKYGIKRDMAYMLSSQMILGSAKLQLESGKHPGELKDQVCSPGGTTILGVEALEKAGLRAALLNAVTAVMGK